jgi:oxaloacetate decarboxylase gamma subunit
MTIAEMFGQSAVLSLLGMGVVFAFLTILIVCMTLVAKLIHALGWDADVQEPKQAGVVSAPTAAVKNSTAAAVPTAAASIPAALPIPRTTEASVVAVVSAAVNQYRKTNS